MVGIFILFLYTDKKENLIFFIYKEIQMRSVAKSEGLPNIWGKRKYVAIYERPLAIYDFATDPV